MSVTGSVTNVLQWHLPTIGVQIIDNKPVAHPDRFNTWLRARRRELGLTQAELGARVGCSAAAIRKFEAGQRRPSSQIAERLAAAFDLLEADRPAFVALARRAGATTSALPSPTAPAISAPPLIGRDTELEQIVRLLAR